MYLQKRKEAEEEEKRRKEKEELEKKARKEAEEEEKRVAELDTATRSDSVNEWEAILGRGAEEHGVVHLPRRPICRRRRLDRLGPQRCAASRLYLHS